MLAPSRPSRACRGVASRPTLPSLRASLFPHYVGMENSGRQPNKEPISPTGMETVLSNTFVRSPEPALLPVEQLGLPAKRA